MILVRWPLITKNKHLLGDPEMTSVTRNYQIYSMQLETFKMVFTKLKIPDFHAE